MKDVFLNELRNELDKVKLSKEEINGIIENHKRMFDLGYDAGLRDADIIKNLGSPKDIAAHYGVYEGLKSDSVDYLKESNPGKKFSYSPKDKYNVSLKLSNDSVYVEYHDGSTIDVYVNGEESKNHTMSFSSNTLKIENKRKIMSFLSSKDKMRIDIYLPKIFKMSKFELSLINGYAEIGPTIAAKIDLQTISGDINASHLKGISINVSTISGQIRVASIDGENAQIKSITGHILVKKMLSDRSKASSIIGNVEILEGDKEVINAKSVAGKVIIEEETKKTTVESIKDKIFKKKED